jgi:hypothetical protein
MKARLIFLFVILFSFSAQAQNFWEPLDGPYGGNYQGFIQANNNIIAYTPRYVIQSSDNAQTWARVYTITNNSAIDRIIKTASGKFYMFIYIYDINQSRVLLSTDDGATWTPSNLLLPKGVSVYSLQLTDDYFFWQSGSQKFISKKKLNDSIVEIIDVENFETKDDKFSYYIVDKHNNIYLLCDRLVYLSTDTGRTFLKISNFENTLHKYSTNSISFDTKENLYFSGRQDSNDVIYFSDNKGLTWDSLIINNVIFSIKPKDKNLIYYWAVDTLNSNGLWVIENRDFKNVKMLSNTMDGSKYLTSFIFVDSVTFVSDGRVYFYTKDKYTKTLYPIIHTAEDNDVLRCGNSLVISGSFSTRNLYSLDNNQFSLITARTGFNYSGDVYLSSKDYIWVTGMGLGPLETQFSSDNALSFKSFGFYYSPISMAENSKKEMYLVNWGGNKLAKSTDQLNWTKVKDVYAEWVFVNNQDEIVLLKRYSDTVNITKLDPGTYNTLFEKNLILIGTLQKFIISKNDDYFFMTDSLLYRSADEGSTFTVVLDAGPVRKLRDLLEMNNMLFISTNQGVMSSADKGATWKDINTGLNSFDCRSIGKTGDNTLYLGLAGDVVYRSVKYTSVEENIAQDEIVCTPNPATDFIEISSPPLERGSGGVVMKIFNVFGQTVSTPVCSADTPASGGQRIDVSGLPPGMYFVRIGDKVGKFVKL